ncbi:MAG TPA: peptidylprolyl isomerase [Aquaticitalea sp.]|nr:peptidylprolyl isomerase [Aquaticitalea sp.]
MRILIVLFGLLFLCNCEDKQSNQKKTTSPSEINKTEALPKKDTSQVQKREFPLLTDENALYFFEEYDKKHKEDKVRITTDFGSIDIQLFPETKYHRANFIFLTKQHYFDNSQFYRVVKNFVIQGGSSDEAELFKKRNHIGRYLLPPDTKKGFKHHRGVVSMPSSEIENAYKMATPYQFFIVQNPNGAYHLDGEYTAFGKVISGMDVVDKIADQPTDDAEWPLHNVYIRKIEVID